MKVMSTVAATALGSLAIQQRVQPVRADIKTMAGVTAAAAGLGTFALTMLPLKDMRDRGESLSHASFATIRAVTDELSFQEFSLLESVTQDISVISDAVDNLNNFYHRTQINDLIQQFWPGSENYPIAFDHKMAGRYVCDPDKVDRFADDLWVEGVDTAWEAIVRAIFGFSTEAAKPETCNVIQVGANLVFAESAADRVINHVSQGLGDAINAHIQRLSTEGSRVENAIDSLLNSTHSILDSVQQSAESLSGVDVSISRIVRNVENISNLLLGKGRFYLLASAFSAAQSMAGGALGGSLVLSLAEIIKLNNRNERWMAAIASGGVPAIHNTVQMMASTGMGLVTGLLTNYVYVKPIEKELNTLKSEAKNLVSDSQLSALLTASIELDHAVGSIVNVVEELSALTNNTLWKELREVENLVLAFPDHQPLENFCNAATNTYAQSRDASVRLLCDLMASVLTMLEEQQLTARLSTDILQSIFMTVFDSIEGLSAYVIDEANVNISSLSESARDLSQVVFKLTHGVRSALENVNQSKAAIGDDIDGLQSTVSWYLPVMLAIFAAGAAYYPILTARNIFTFSPGHPDESTNTQQVAFAIDHGSESSGSRV